MKEVERMTVIDLNKKLNLIQGDCLEVLKQIPDESIDLICTDPPYGINYKSNHGSKKYKQKIQNHQWDKNFNLEPFFKEMKRIAKNNTYIFVFGTEENLQTLTKYKWDRVLVWDKCHNGMGNLKCFGVGYEFIFMKKVGQPKLLSTRINGVINFKHIGYFQKTIHPTQKPVKLMEILIENCCIGEGLVLDCFMGSGTTGVAALKLGRRFIGIELDEKYFKIAEERCKEWENQERLF